MQANDKMIVDQNLQRFSKNTRVFSLSMIRLMISSLFKERYSLGPSTGFRPRENEVTRFDTNRSVDKNL